MSDTGDIWYSALSGLGQNIANTIQEYHHRKRDQDMVQGQLEMFRNTIVNGKPMLDDKSYEAMSQYMQRHKDIGAAVVQERLQFMQSLATEGAKARVKENEFMRRERIKAGIQERLIDDRERAGEKRDKAKKETDFQDVFVHNMSEELGTFDPKQGFTGTDEKEATHARIVDQEGNAHIMPIATYRSGKSTAAKSRDLDKLKPGRTYSERALAIKQMWKEHKLTDAAAVRALKALGEGFSD